MLCGSWIYENGKKKRLPPAINLSLGADVVVLSETGNTRFLKFVFIDLLKAGYMPYYKKYLLNN